MSRILRIAECVIARPGVIFPCGLLADNRETDRAPRKTQNRCIVVVSGSKGFTDSHIRIRKKSLIDPYQVILTPENTYTVKILHSRGWSEKILKNETNRQLHYFFRLRILKPWFGTSVSNVRDLLCRCQAWIQGNTLVMALSIEEAGSHAWEFGRGCI